MRRLNVRSWHKADMPLAATNVGFGGKADITVVGPECPLMTQSGHRVSCYPFKWMGYGGTMVRVEPRG